MISHKKILHKPVIFLICLLLFVFSSTPALIGADGDRDTEVSIDNGFLRIGLDQRDGNLLELVDLGTKHNHLGDGPYPIGLWELDVLVEGQPTVLTPAQSESFRWKILPPGQMLRLTWDGFTHPGAGDCKIEVTVRLDAGTPMSRWKITVNKPPGLALRRIHFPRAFGLRKQPSERLAVPALMGQLTTDPRGLLRGREGRGQRLTWNYPDRLSVHAWRITTKAGTDFTPRVTIPRP
jgi:hypothetical protein